MPPSPTPHPRKKRAGIIIKGANHEIIPFPAPGFEDAVNLYPNRDGILQLISDSSNIDYLTKSPNQPDFLSAARRALRPAIRTQLQTWQHNRINGIINR